MRDSQKIMSIYRSYLESTGDLVEILERHYEQLDKDESHDLKNKRKEFSKHEQKIIESFHNDVHVLFRISHELRNLEKSEGV